MKNRQYKVRLIEYTEDGSVKRVEFFGKPPVYKLTRTDEKGTVVLAMGASLETVTHRFGSGKTSNNKPEKFESSPIKFSNTPSI